ncbi:hypothetical protein L209DRAFT_179856 [Thermothelomyces heterothallicus CBS 203.75]
MRNTGQRAAAKLARQVMVRGRFRAARICQVTSGEACQTEQLPILLRRRDITSLDAGQTGKARPGKARQGKARRVRGEMG